MQLWSARSYVSPLVFCFFFTVVDSQRIGAIRLVDGADDSEGRVEIYANYSWGTVCSYSWGQADAKVVCRELGFTDLDVSLARTWGYFGSGTGSVHLNYVGCSGSEARLYDCYHNGIGNNNCYHSYDAGVSCYCKSNPACEKPIEQCPYFRQEVHFPQHKRCPACRCASCPVQPRCPSNCKSGRTMYYDGQYCRRCRCVPQDLPDFIEEPNSISVGMMVAAVMVMLVIPVVLLIIVLVYRKMRQNSQAKSKAAKAQEEQNGVNDI